MQSSTTKQHQLRTALHYEKESSEQTWTERERENAREGDICWEELDDN